MTESSALIPKAAPDLTGYEKFAGTGGARVIDFWKFALGDLRMNNARGYLAEFLVARALGVKPLKRVEWDTYDLKLGETTIEVKASAYLQAWDQRRLSDVKFTGLWATPFAPAVPGAPAAARPKTLNAMVYVLCAQVATEHEKYDPLDVSQWEFYVVARSKIEATGLGSISLTRARELAGTTTAWTDLVAAVEAAAVDENLD